MTEPWYGDRDPQEVDMGCGEYDGTSCELCGRERVMVGGATSKRICEKCGTYQAQPWTPKILDARNALMRFTPETPAWVGPTVYKVMADEPAFADLMDRVKVYAELPNGYDGIYELKNGPLTGDELRLLRDRVPMTPGPTGARYGPYDADPHTKGRRRRFRTQRKA